MTVGGMNGQREQNMDGTNTNDSGRGRGVDRRQFLGGAAVAGLVAVSSIGFSTAADAATASTAATRRHASHSGFPPFSWDTVPVAADVGDRLRVFSRDEAKFLATHFSILSIEKGAAIGSRPADEQWTEPGFLEDARRIKEANPEAKVLFYWNSYVHFDWYKANSQFDPSWLQSDEGGTLLHDLNNADFREWWVDVATRMVAEHPEVDGVFIDGVGHAIRDDLLSPLETMVGALRTKLDRLGRPKLMMANTGGLTDEAGNLNPILEIVDGGMYEPFDKYTENTPDILAQVMRGMKVAAEAGKITLLKTWPISPIDFDWRTPGMTYEQQVEIARAEITFPLACFLVAAHQYSYLQYSWGYSRTEEFDNGVWIRTSDGADTVDRDWYPELRRPLGPPRGDAHIEGYVWTRRFVHADVEVNLEAKTAAITWRR